MSSATLKLCSWICLALSPCKALSLQMPIPEVELPLTGTRPAIDGVIHEDEWQEAARLVGFMKDGSALEPREAVFWLTCDGDRLYLAVKTEVPPSGSLLAQVIPTTGKGTEVFLDDCLEFWIDPHRQTMGQDRRYFQVAVNPLGTTYCRAYDPADKQQTLRTDWRVEWELGNKVEGRWWSVEAAIPLASIGATREDLRHPWGLRVCRNWQQPAGQTDWAPFTGAFDDQSTMAIVRWNPEAPVVRMLGLRDPEKKSVNVEVEIRNSTAKPKEVALAFEQKLGGGTPVYLKESHVIPPKGSRRFAMAAADTQGTCVSSLKVTSEAGDRTWFLRGFTWDVAKPAKLWTAVATEARAANLDFGYYPYFHRIKARMDISGLGVRDEVRGAVVRVKEKKSGKVIKEGLLPSFKNGLSETVLVLPALAEGTYLVEGVLQGSGRAPTQPIQKEFIRKVYPWEHNKLGITDQVIPPFTPLVVRGSEVSAVLRTHRMSREGTWNQVLSEGVPVLAAPMRWEVVTNGQPQKVRPSKLKWTTRRPNEATYETGWKAGGLHARVIGSYDVDGFLKMELTLHAEKTEKVNQLDLLVPFNPAVATLMNVCADGFLPGYAGRLPAGDGLIWESKKAVHNKLAGTFVPYVWIGNESQGLCWMADSDRDWLVDDSISTHEVHRERDRVVLKVRFVTKPGPLKRERRIIFALQATPSKPMPDQPAHWRKWVFDYQLAEQYNIYIVPTCWEWGAWAPYGDFYPRRRDMSVYDLMRDTRQSGAINNDRLEKWLDGYEREDDVGMEIYTRCLKCTLHRMTTKPDGVVFYTALRDCAYHEEFQVFQDEWLNVGYNNREWNLADKRASVGYAAFPTRSRQDFALWYFKKILESGAGEGIYFDNAYPNANFNNVSGGAYAADDGTLRPSCDLFLTREYFKRVQTLCWQMGKPWLNVAHMTTSQVVPCNTWVGINLNWELKYGMDDFQDRFPRDFMRADTIGVQSGCVPLVLPGIQGSEDPERLEWVTRTQLATTLVHEIKLLGLKTYRTSGIAVKVLGALYDFGYGEPGCKVYRYWDKGFPLKLSGAEAEALLLEKSSEIMIFVADFGEGGNCTVQAAPELLKVRSGLVLSDVETGQPVTRAGPTEWSFDLRKHDFKLLSSVTGLAQDRSSGSTKPAR